MARDPRAESWLTNEGVQWTYLDQVPLEQFDIRRSLSNQSRLTTKPLNDQVVEEYAAAMREGAAFPAVLVWKGPAGYVHISGNHRLAAAKQAEKTHFDAYLVDTQDTYILDRLTRSANLFEGMRPSREEILAHGKHLVITYGHSVREVAAALQLHEMVLGDAVRADQTRNRILTLGQKGESLGKGVLKVLNGVTSDPVLRAAAALAIDAQLRVDDVGEMVKEIRSARSEADQLAVVESWRDKAIVRQQIAESRAGKVKIDQTRRKLFDHLFALSDFFKGCDTLEQAQLTNPAHVKDVDRLIVGIHQRFRKLVEHGTQARRTPTGQVEPVAAAAGGRAR